MKLLSRRSFLASAAWSTAACFRPACLWSSEEQDARVTRLVARTLGIDTHNHIDVPLTSQEAPGPDLDLRGELTKSGLAAICMTFATDYQAGDPYARFQQGMAAMDRQLARNGLKRALSAADVRSAHSAGQPTVVQAVEGAHFLEGHLERVGQVYERGLRHFGLLHDSDASVPLGDVYTNPPRFGGLTTFGSAVVKECNRLGILIDLAHADRHTTEMAIKLSSRPVIVSHTGLDTQLGSDARMAQMMRPRLIGKEQAKLVADSGGVIGVWTHLADTPLEYAQNVRAMVDVIGIDHVCIGTDTKLTPPGARPGGPPPGRPHEGEPSPGAGGPQGPTNDRPMGQRRRFGERTNEAWADQTVGFYYVVVAAMLQVGFGESEIARIGGENYLRLLAQAAQ